MGGDCALVIVAYVVTLFMQLTHDGRWLTTTDGNTVRMWDATNLSTPVKTFTVTYPLEAASYCPAKVGETQLRSSAVLVFAGFATTCDPTPCSSWLACPDTELGAVLRCPCLSCSLALLLVVVICGFICMTATQAQSWRSTRGTMGLCTQSGEATKGLVAGVMGHKRHCISSTGCYMRSFDALMHWGLPWLLLE